MVATRQSSHPIQDVVAASEGSRSGISSTPTAGTWALRRRARSRAGCRAICVTVGVSSSDHRPAPTDWDAVGGLAEAVDVPVVVKGIMSVDAAETAVAVGAQGLVVSNHGGLVDRGNRHPGHRHAAGGGGRRSGPRSRARRR